MFWRVPSYSQASPLEGILDKQKFTLEELLDEEDLIQECKALNGRLLNFLLQPDSIEQLITYFTVQSPLPPGLDEAEVQKRWSKFPFAACEVFCCEVDAIFNTLFGSEHLMAKLFSIVGTDKLPDITLSGYFARPVPRDGDKKAPDRQPIRAGYLGHLVLLGNSLLEASSRRTDIRTALQASPDWQKYVQGPLGEANNRQDVMQWACGRPSKETLSTFKSTDDIMIDETDAPEEGSVNRHLMRYNSLEDDDGDVSLPADKDFSEAADALGSLNLSEGWSSLSLRSRHSESGAQDAELRAQRGDPFEENRSHREAGQEEGEDQYRSAQSDGSYENQSTEVTMDVSRFLSRLLSPPAKEDSGIDDDVLVMTEDYDDLMDEDVVVIDGAHKSGDRRSHGENSWAEFDDLATERSSRLNSAESTQRPESQSSPFTQEQRPSTASSDAGGGWAAFGSDPPAFPSNDSTFQEESAAFGEDPSSRQGHQKSKQSFESDAQSPPSASWAAFDEPEPSPADSTSVGSTQRGQGDTSVVDNAQHGKPDSTTASEQADEKPLPNAAFGESNYWRTHPLDLVDIVD
ncbi:hypothetical protein WJX79_010824 [Trebouxia sp. C0005]